MGNVPGMDFGTYWQKLDDAKQKAFANDCDTSQGYLNLCALGHKNIGPNLAMCIERASHGAVPCEVSCPNSPWEVVRGKKRLAKKQPARKVAA